MTMTDTSEAHAARTSAPAPGRLFRATLLISATLTIMAAAVIAPSLPEMSRVYSGVPAAEVLVRLALTITSLAIGLTATVAGAVADRIGRKPVLVGSLVLYALAGVSGYAATDLTLLLTTRAVLGVAVGGIMSSVTVMITDLFEGPRRARFLGLQSAAASVGGVVFLPLAGVLAGVSWRAPFWIYAVAVLIVPLALLGVRETHARTHRPDPAAAPVRSGATRRRPLIPLIFGVATVGTLAFFMAPTQLPFLLQELGLSPAIVGFAVAASTASSAVAAVLYARVARRATRASVTVLSLVSLGVGWIVVGLSASLAGVLVGVLVGGVGVGLIIPNLNLWLSELVPAQERGRILGGLVSAIFIGQFLSPLLLQPVVSAVGLGDAFLLSGIALVIGATALVAVFRAVGAASR